MGDKRRFVVDIEGDSLQATRLWVVSYCDVANGIVKSITDYPTMRRFFEQENVEFIGHNFILYDSVQIHKVLGINIKSRIIDTLAISWYLNASNGRKVHGLEQYGTEYGIPKPEVTVYDDPELLPLYIHRCEEDVKINYRLWQDQQALLQQIYEDQETLDKFYSYLYFKMDCIRDQEALGIRFDEDRCRRVLAKLEEERLGKMTELEKAMPKIPIVKKKSKPAKMYNIKGQLTVAGKAWLDLLEANGIPETYEGIVEIQDGYKEPNAKSTDQKKAWLYSLGWVPENIKFERNKTTHEVKQIPQIKAKDTEDGDICDSVKKLIEKEPAVELLAGLGIINHRITVFEGFLRDQVNGRLYASAAGFTNTMRFAHRTIVNLVGVDKPYGEDIRGCLMADEGTIMAGMDLKNIEDMTKRHYIFKYDPEYVIELSDPSFDAHLDIAEKAGFLTKEQVQAHKDGTEHFNKERKLGKVTNFSSTYKVGKKTLARSANIKESLAQKIIDAFWVRNKAILDIEEDTHIKEIGDQLWLKNPISGFYLSLRNRRDIFSTLNQSSAVYVFDVWLGYVRGKGIRISLQMHDEMAGCLKEHDKESFKEKVLDAIELTNNKLKLNVTIACSMDFGERYSDCH